jgi:hypothetical protein
MTLLGCFTDLMVQLLSNRLTPSGLLTLHLEALMHLNMDSSVYMTLDQSAALKWR